MGSLTIVLHVLVVSEFVVTSYATDPPRTMPTMPPGTPCEVCLNGICSGQFINCPPLTPVCAKASYTENGIGMYVSTCKTAAQCPGFINDYKDKEDSVVSFLLLWKAGYFTS